MNDYLLWLRRSVGPVHVVLCSLVRDLWTFDVNVSVLYILYNVCNIPICGQLYLAANVYMPNVYRERWRFLQKFSPILETKLSASKTELGPAQSEIFILCYWRYNRCFRVCARWVVGYTISRAIFYTSIFFWGMLVYVHRICDSDRI